MNLSFTAFTFNNFATAEHNLHVVSNSGRYTAPLTPSFENRTTSVPGRPGLLYWGTDLANQEFSLSLATDGITGQQLNSLKQALRPGESGLLTFAEAPYKSYYALVASTPVLNFVPFLDGTGRENIYKGEIELTFITLSPYAYGKNAIISDTNALKPEYSESGMPRQPADFSLTDNRFYFLMDLVRVRNGIIQTTPTPAGTSFYIYHAGNAPAQALLRFQQTYTLGVISGIVAPKSSWNNIDISGGGAMSKPRFLLDIETMLQDVLDYSATWETARLQVLEMLKDKLDGPHKSVLITAATNFGAGRTYPNYNDLVTHIRTQFFTSKTYTIEIDGIHKQVTLTMGDYTSDESGSYNGKFIEILPSGILPVSEGAQPITFSTNITDLRITFQNTYV